MEARAGVGVGGCGRGDDKDLRLVVNLWVFFEDLVWSAGLKNLWRMFRSFEGELGVGRLGGYWTVHCYHGERTSLLRSIGSGG